MSEHPLDSPPEAEVEFDCPHCGASQHCAQERLGHVVHCAECGGGILLPSQDELAEEDTDPPAEVDAGNADSAEGAEGVDEVERWEGGEGGEGGEGESALDPVQPFDADGAADGEAVVNVGVGPVDECGDAEDARLKTSRETEQITGQPDHEDGAPDPAGSEAGRQLGAGIGDAEGPEAGASPEASEAPGITAGTGGAEVPEKAASAVAPGGPGSGGTKTKLPERRTGTGLRKEFRQQMDRAGEVGGVATGSVGSEGGAEATEVPPRHAEAPQKGPANPEDSGADAAPPDAGVAGGSPGKAEDYSVPGTPPPEVPAKAAAPKGVRSFVKDPEKERKRLFAAAGIGADGRLARVAGLDTLIFRCPDCSQQSVISSAVLGREISCEQCGALLKMPADDKGRVELVARGCLSEREKRMLTPLPEPGEATPGDRKTPKLTPLGDVLVDRDADVAWGAEKKEVAAPRRKRRALFLIPVALAAFLVALLVIFARAPGRVADEAVESSREARAPAMGPSGEVDWANIDRAQRIELATEAVRRFVESKSLDDLEAASRPRDGLRESMEHHYDLEGGYVSEVRRHGSLAAAQVVESRTLGQQPLLIISTRFQDGASGTHALFQAEDGYLVDWDYAVGYSEASLEELREDPPSRPVLMRGYLEEDVFFIHGFTADEWRMFDFHCPQMISSVVVYARRDSEIERKLREAWTDSGIQRVGLADGPATRLDFTLRVSFLDDGVRKGLVIDDVLARGWILVD